MTIYCPNTATDNVNRGNPIDANPPVPPLPVDPLAILNALSIQLGAAREAGKRHLVLLVTPEGARALIEYYHAGGRYPGWHTIEETYDFDAGDFGPNLVGTFCGRPVICLEAWK